MERDREWKQRGGKGGEREGGKTRATKEHSGLMSKCEATERGEENGGLTKRERRRADNE